ncbi:methyl-accepting chemotaxis protein [Pseudomonas sp. XS1P51]
MTHFNNLRLSAKLAIAFVFFSLMTLAIGLMGMAGNKKLSAMMQDLQTHTIVSINTVNELFSNALLHNRSLYFLLSQKADNATDADLNETIEQLQIKQASINETFSVYQALTLNNNEVASRDKLKQDWDKYTALLQEYLTAIRADNYLLAKKLLNGKVRISFVQIQKDADLIVSTNTAQARVAEQNANQLIRLLDLSMIVGIIVAFLVAAGLGVLITRSITHPLARALLTAQQVANGDLTVPIQVSSKDETGQLLYALQTMQENLKATVQRITDASEQLATASGNMSLITQTTGNGLIRQNDEIQQAATAVTQMTTAVDEVARNAVSTSQVSQETDACTQNGQVKVQQTIKSIEDMVNEIDASSTMVVDLAAQTKAISSVLDVIRAIAEQTNLLALNAAIEAARAGEQGRGFAVVADEVRALAHRTQSSTGEIEGMIGAVQNRAQQAARAMSETQKLANRTRSLAREAGAALDVIASGVTQISERNRVIAGASEEQAHVAREVDRNLINIRSLSAQTAEGVEQTGASSEELSRLSDSLNKLVTRFRL